MIRRYFRIPDGNLNKNGEDSRGRPIGVAIASEPSEDGSVAIGFSLCSEHDSFDRSHGLMIAEQRLNSGQYIVPSFEVPIEVVNNNFRAQSTNPSERRVFDVMGFEINWVVKESRRRANLRTRSES